MLAVVLVVARFVVVALACMALMLGTVVGFILADTVGIFGFTLPAVTGWAYEALITELLSAVVLAVLVLRAWRTARLAEAADPARRCAGDGQPRLGRVALAACEPARRRIYVAAMPTMGALRCRPPMEP